MNALDYIAIVIFLLGIIGVGLWRRASSLEGYWVNERSTSVSILTLSIIATSVGSGMVFGVVSLGYVGGLVGLYMGVFNAAGLILLGLLAPKIKNLADAGKMHSLPDLLQRIYSKRCKLVGASVNAIVYFFFLAGQLIALGAVSKVVTGVPYQASLFVALLILLVYTYVGGIRTDLITDAIQFFFIILFILLLTPPLFHETGSFGALSDLPSSYFTGTAYGGASFLIGMLIFFTPVPLVMMDLWLRIYAARDKGGARKSLFISAIVILPIFAAFALFGMATKVLLPEIDPTFATSELVFKYLPVGLRGLMIAGFLAAIMSTADSMLVVTGITLIKDFYGSIKPGGLANESRVLLMSRLLSVVVGVLAVVVALLLPNIVQVMLSAFSVLMVLLPAVLGGLFAKRKSEAAAFWSILLGLGVTLFCLPILPKEAFIPGVTVSFVTYFVVAAGSRRKDLAIEGSNRSE